jgi:hypothetical protein
VISAATLREKAREYELNQLAAQERGDKAAALSFATVALVLYELAGLDAEEYEEAA